MSKRFKSTLDEDTMSIMPYLVSDNEEECFYNLEDCVDLLNEQQSAIEEKDKEIAELKLEKFEEQKNDDIHKWTDGRYALMFDEHTFFVRDNAKEKCMNALQVTEKLNEQQAIIQKEKGEKINAEEKLSYMVWKYNKLKQKNFDLQVKLSEVIENDE